MPLAILRFTKNGIRVFSQGALMNDESIDAQCIPGATFKPDGYYTEEISVIPLGLLCRVMRLQLPWPISHISAFLIWVCGKLDFKLGAQNGPGIPGTEAIVSREDLPFEAISVMLPYLLQSQDLGFEELRFSISKTIGRKQEVTATLIDPTGQVIMTLTWIRSWSEGIDDIIKVNYEFNSYGGTDPELLTCAVDNEDILLGEIFTLDFVDSEFVSNDLPLEKAYQLHQKRIGSRNFFQMDADSALAEHRQRQVRRMQWAIEKGIYRPLTSSETRQLQQANGSDSAQSSLTN